MSVSTERTVSKCTVTNLWMETEVTDISVKSYPRHHSRYVELLYVEKNNCRSNYAVLRDTPVNWIRVLELQDRLNSLCIRQNEMNDFRKKKITELKYFGSYFPKKFYIFCDNEKLQELQRNTLLGKHVASCVIIVEFISKSNVQFQFIKCISVFSSTCNFLNSDLNYSLSVTNMYIFDRYAIYDKSGN